ncbi:MAG: hypothetical protein INQ03_22705 [Candidatus Heimdallarchaeota archaeon]|nr:hypothetical protein [Candidatus Heimdallarchaeota archaeon]
MELIEKAFYSYIILAIIRFVDLFTHMISNLLNIPEVFVVDTNITLSDYVVYLIYVTFPSLVAFSLAYFYFISNNSKLQLPNINNYTIFMWLRMGLSYFLSINQVSTILQSYENEVYIQPNLLLYMVSDLLLTIVGGYFVLKLPSFPSLKAIKIIYFVEIVVLLVIQISLPMLLAYNNYSDEGFRLYYIINTIYQITFDFLTIYYLKRFIIDDLMLRY